ncbi:MAG TPA: hypothetical protein VNF05_09405, partial [Acidimicrobiales bacterium]|nr:hypothetical protein [Acidimicrobiales bacterium]
MSAPLSHLRSGGDVSHRLVTNLRSRFPRATATKRGDAPTRAPSESVSALEAASGFEPEYGALQAP